MAITFTEGLEPVRVKEPPSFRSANESERRTIVALQGFNGYTNPLETDVTFPRGVYECNITNAGSGYVTPPIITITNLGSSAGSGATATTTLNSNTVSAITMTNNGTGYTAIPTVAITGSDTDILFTFTHDDVSVSANTITKIAHGLSNGDRIHLTTTNRLPLGLYDTDTIGNIIPNPDYYIVNKTDDTFQLSKTSGGTVVNIKDVGQPTATAVLGGAVVAGIWLSTGGGPFITTPTVVITGDGTGATATAVLTDGRVTKINMTNYGSGYSTIPTVSFSGGMGTHTVRKGGGASATAVIGQGATAKVATSTAGVITGITMLTSGGGTGATATASNIGDSVASTSGLSGGSGYSSAPTISFTGGDGTGAAATATESGGAVTGITITSGGSGYTSAPTMVFSGGGGSGASATAVLEVHTYLTSVAITAGGSGYQTVPSVTFSDPSSGTTATGTATVSGGAVTGITLTNAGSGYSTLPTMVFFGGGKYINTSVQISSGADGSGATATCTLEAAAVKTSTVTAGGTKYASLISLVDKATAVSTAPISTDKAVAVAESAVMANWMTDNGGSGYSSAPTVSFSGGGGSGAAGTASVSNGKVTAVSITSGGSGYSSAPSISYSGGGGSGAGGTVILSGSTVSSVKISNLPTAWESAGYTAADVSTVKTVVDVFITKCTEAENAIASLLAQISTVTTGNFLEHNHMLCGLRTARPDPYKPAYHELMGLINTVERLKDYFGVPFENYTLKLFSTLWIGDDVIDTAMAHLYIDPLSAGTYDDLNIQAAMEAASSNATTLAANVTAVKAPLEVWVSNVSGDVGAFNTLRTNDEAEYVSAQAWQDYVMEGLKNNGYWTQDYTKLGWTDVVGSIAAKEIVTDIDNATIT